MQRLVLALALAIGLLQGAVAATNAQVFAYAQAQFPALFSGTPTAGTYLQYDYRYFPGSGNYLAIDTSGNISLLGPYTNNAIVVVGPVSAFAAEVDAWVAAQGGLPPGTSLLSGAVQGKALALAGAVTTLPGTYSSAYGIATDGKFLFVASARQVDKVSLSDASVTNVAKGVVSTVPPYETSLNTLGGITTVDGKTLYVADAQRLKKIDVATGEVTTIAGSATFGSADGIGTAATFRSLQGVTTDGTNLYLADMTSNTIRKVELATLKVSTLAGTCCTSGQADGAANVARFNAPTGLVTDGHFLYVADDGNSKIRKVDIATGAVTTLAGSGAASSVDGTGTQASFVDPFGITTDGTSLYVVDRSKSVIRKIDLATSRVTTLAGSGTWALVDGSGTAASFSKPTHITTDGRSLYIVDTNNGKLRALK